MEKVSTGSKQKNKKDLEGIGNRRWGMGGSEEGWGPAAGTGGAEKSTRPWDGKEIARVLSGQFQGHVSTKEMKGQMSAAERELESAFCQLPQRKCWALTPYSIS